MKPLIKKITLLSIIATTVILCYSFAAMYKTSPENKIGFIDSKGNFIPVSHQQLTSFFQNINHIEKDAKAKKFIVADVIDKNTQTKHYFIKATFTEGAYIINLASSLKKINNTQFVIVGETCSCKSKECATSVGCDVLVPMPPCVCSPCNGDCEKTNTKTSTTDIEAFFNQ